MRQLSRGLPTRGLASAIIVTSGTGSFVPSMRRGKMNTGYLKLLGEVCVSRARLVWCGISVRLAVRLCEAAGTQKQLQGGAGWQPAVEEMGQTHPPHRLHPWLAHAVRNQPWLWCDQVSQWLNGHAGQGKLVQKILLPGKTRRFKVWCWKLCLARVQSSPPDTAILLYPDADQVHWSDSLPEDGAQETTDQHIVQSITHSKAFSASLMALKVSFWGSGTRSRGLFLWKCLFSMWHPFLLE